MKIRNIGLDNIKLFNNLKLSFIDNNTNEPHNVILIVGENGTGKTTILKAIVSCFTVNNSSYDGEVFSYEDVSANEDIAKIAVDTKMNEKEISYFENLGSTTNEYSFFQCIVKNDGVKYGNNILRKNNTIYLTDINNRVVNYSENELQINLQDKFKKESYTGSLILYFDVFRIIPRIQINGPDNSKLPSSPKSKSLASSIQRNNVFERFNYTKQWLINLDYKEDKTYRQIGKDSGLMQEVINAFNILFAPYKFSRITYESKILFSTPNGEVDIDNLSDGLKSVFAIIGEILYRFSIPYMSHDNIDIEAVLNTEAIVLIDEIDCHLHPKWQLNIIPSLRKLFPNVQFIITTHAPLVVSSVYPDEVYRLGEI